FLRGKKIRTNHLEIIHTDIYCIDIDASSLKYFITFIDDYSQYMYLYLLCYKDEALNVFKVFKVEVEKQYGKQIKIMRFDRGGEYARYTVNGQAFGPFVKFLLKHGIVAQYTMFDSLDQNGVAKQRRNQTLMDMVRSMRSNAKLPQFFTKDDNIYIKLSFDQGCLEETFCVAQRLETKFGCLFEVRIYSPQENKLDPRTISGYFIGYAKKYKGYRVYCLTIHNTRIVESRKFLENDLISMSDRFQDIVNENDHCKAQSSRSSDKMIVIHIPQVQKRIKLLMRNNKIVLNNNQLNIRPTIVKKKSTIPSDYAVYLQESKYNIGAENDPKMFSQAMSSKE
ncbi:hypothetical protein CR513_57392, partial [Mucuna pruriens]